MYTIMARSRPTILSQMRLGQKLKMHANIALSLEKVEFDAFLGKMAWLNQYDNVVITILGSFSSDWWLPIIKENYYCNLPYVATNMIHRKGNLVALFLCTFNYISYQCSDFDKIVCISNESTLVIPMPILKKCMIYIAAIFKIICTKHVLVLACWV